jgi:hypothetical protein
MLKTYSFAILATAWLVVVPAPVYSQLVELTPNNPRPIVCTGTNRNLQSDFVSVESDAFLKPPYNRYNSKAYNMWLYLCASDNPLGCKRINTWTYDQKPCSGGSGVPCKWGVSLKSPRAVSIYFLALIYDKANRQVTTQNNAKILKVTWTNVRGPCPGQPPPPRTVLPSVSIRVTGGGANGGCSANTDSPGQTCTAAATITLPPDGSNQTIQLVIHAEMNNWPQAPTSGKTLWHLLTGGLGIRRECNTGTVCEFRVNLSANTPMAPTDVEAGTIYDPSAGARDGRMGSWVVPGVTAKVNLTFRKPPRR